MSAVSLTYILFYLVICKAEKNVPLTSPDGRIFNGRTAYLGQFPHQALLEAPVSSTSFISCGGSLISPTYVITAAHCVYGRTMGVNIYLGLINSRTKLGAVKRTVSDINIHPQYNPTKFVNDIALLKLSNSVGETRYIKAIALPKASQSSPTTYDNTYAIASGWGQTFDGERGQHPSLQYSRIRVAAHSYCSQLLKNFDFGNQQICTDKTIYSAPCKGDSGGPLSNYPNFPSLSSPVLIGLVSWGLGNCSNPYPNVYTYVGGYLPYISQVTGINTN